MHGTELQASRGAVWRRRRLQRIAMLCRQGGGLQAIAGPFCAAVSELIGADAGMIIWFSADGAPEGFYHQTATAEVNDLFVTKLEADFHTSEPVSAWSLAAPGGQVVGRMLAPGMQARFEQGRIYEYLCRPIGHRHLLDMSAQGSNGAVAGFFAWNASNRPFGKAHAEALLPVQTWFQAALEADSTQARWATISTGTPHLICSQDGRSLLAIDAEAERILSASLLLRQNLSCNGKLRVAPPFLATIAAQLLESDSVTLPLPVANGRIVCRAERTRFLRADQDDEWQIFVGIELQACINTRQIDRIARLDLTDLQSAILLGAMQGKARSDCQAELGISDAALKKHLHAVFTCTGAANWSDLRMFG